MSDQVEIKNGIHIECVQGDITNQPDLDVIVNAANAQLMTGGGVAGAIHRAAGPELARACAPLAPIRPGEAVITEGFGLPNAYVIHCLGPVYGVDEPSDRLLGDCYRDGVLLADKHGLSSIGFPALSTGAFGYPMGPAAKVAFSTLVSAADRFSSVRLIRFVLFSGEDMELHQQVLREVLEQAG